MVIEADPIPDHATGVLQGLEPVAVHALLLEGSDDPLDHTVLLGAVGRDELLAQPVAFDQGRVASAGEDQWCWGVAQAGGLSRWWCAGLSQGFGSGIVLLG